MKIMKKCIIISALGEQTFNMTQLERLKNSMNVDFYTQTEELKSNKFIDIVKDYDIVGITRRPIKDIDKTVFKELPKLKGLAIFSTGYEWIDVKYLNQCGVKVSYLPEYSTVSVAEHTMGMLFAVLRRIHLSYDYAREIIDNSVSMRGYELYKKRVGIIGFGRIGQKVCAMLSPFETEIKVYDIDNNKKSEAGDKFELRENILKESDIIILCASKERGAGPIIGKSEIEMMKNNVIIINPARADLVDNIEISNGIKSKKIFSYAVDEKVELFRKEKIEIGRVLETAHTAWYSTEAISRGIDMWADNILGLYSGEYKNIVGD